MAFKARSLFIAAIGLAVAGTTAWRLQGGALPVAPEGVQTQVASKSGPGKNAAQKPVSVEVAQVRTMALHDEAQAVGSLRSRRSVVLRPEVSARVTHIHFSDGARVRKGQVLVQFDDQLPRAQIQQSQAELSIAQANHKRNQELLEKKFVTAQALDNSAATLKVQEAAVQLAEAKVGRMRIKAPFNGMVGLRNVSVGDYVKEGQDLINIEDIGTLRVDFKLPETYLGRVVKGQVVEVSTDALPGEQFKAVLDAVDPMVDQNGRAISSRARLDNATGRLRPGMFVRVRLLFGERKNVLMAPEQAIVPGAQPSVFKVVDGKAVLTKVRLGVRRAAQVEIIDGLADGDIVVTAGQLKLRDGAPVRAIGEGGAAAPPAAGMEGMSGMAPAKAAEAK